MGRRPLPLCTLTRDGHAWPALTRPLKHRPRDYIALDQHHKTSSQLTFSEAEGTPALVKFYQNPDPPATSPDPWPLIAATATEKKERSGV